MDWKRFDRTRRQAEPAQLDLIEAYAQGRVSRRDFVKRGAVIGLSMPLLGSVIAACRSGDEASTTTTQGQGSTAGSTAASTEPTGGVTTPSSVSATTAPRPGAAGSTLTFASSQPLGDLDPVLMLDVGSYGLVAQSFEFLVAWDAAGALSPGLAESWTPNGDGSVWTFRIRSGATWMDTGAPVTAVDVAATMDRLVEAGNADLDGVLDTGGVDASDPATAVFNLERSHASFPLLVSLLNPQAVITPGDYEIGTTLDGRASGSGPFRLVDFDGSRGAVFDRNPDWWAGPARLEHIAFEFFDDEAAQVAAVASGSVDAIVRFTVADGGELLNDPEFVVYAAQTAAHRQVWMRTDEGPFADRRVRQAFAHSVDRQRMVQMLLRGFADVGNDHVIAPFLPFFVADQPAQREFDPERARQLLADAGVEGVQVPLHYPEIAEIPDLARFISDTAAEAGFEIVLTPQDPDTFYSSAWCPASPSDPPCSGSQPLGIVDYGSRTLPDLYLRTAFATGGIRNASQYSSSEFDAAVNEYRAAFDVDAQAAAIGEIEAILHDDVPAVVPYFINSLAGHSSRFRDVKVSAVGQPILGNAAVVETP